ncbi:asparagine synthase (glutamine-hydrolyzing) [Candidatus Gottesmanbacteria bacterium RIFCSPHIGHO2_02_FULL_39_11]|uniref:asparagine synthase (glutamine-hydrolyzing) n=1 Tax=Candidatus Gottesmanbacteria bacterium RIFCSPHIGHO2_02_FULL_39_11 TaxID=1798382 RepID=A0A1F5ZK24_9BACT|nr:MAG: asparagine synthase (glutamine-hydrolyzing) [Candidatus Gottesmanbacteria bacterium RIFCSPHIGHO2_02_FULL_39_11]
MCGIGGMYRFDGKKPDSSVLQKMSASIAHRGPDGSGIDIESNVGLIHRRLAIIDPSPRGRQPMSTKNGNFRITFNGEIFNYKKIRRKLENSGYHFRTHTDTETLLYGYEFWGENIVHELSGQFAFCIWDVKKSKLFLARDHTGIIPLYYLFNKNVFLFSSEVKGLLASGLMDREINPESIHHYLSMFTIPSPLTIFKNAHSLLSGHTLSVDDKGIRTKKYWEIPIGTWSQNTIRIPEAKEKLSKILTKSVIEATVSDVPIGAFLSGGIDSSTIVGIMATHTKSKIKTYSLWAEGGDAYDERKYAKLIAEKYDTDHTEFTVSEDEIIAELPNVIYYLDQPNGGSLETYFISKLTAQSVKVALSGLGGDELFAGYHKDLHSIKELSAIYRSVPYPLRNMFLRLFRSLPVSLDLKKTASVADRLLGLSSIAQKYMFLYFAYQEYEKKALYSREFRDKIGNANTENYFGSFFNQVSQMSDIDQLYYVDLQTYTRDDLLENMNMMSMAHALETRVPFLNPDLIQFAASVPPAWKLGGNVTKKILKDVARKWIPDEIIFHKKTGFALPRVQYMNGKLKKHICSVLSKESVSKRGFFNPKYISEELNRFYHPQSSKMLWSEHLRVWILFIFELWCRINLDRRNFIISSTKLSELTGV